jgi:hypothetical protein
MISSRDRVFDDQYRKMSIQVTFDASSCAQSLREFDLERGLYGVIVL